MYLRELKLFQESQFNSIFPKRILFISSFYILLGKRGEKMTGCYTQRWSITERAFNVNFPVRCSFVDEHYSLSVITGALIAPIASITA